MPFIFNFLHWFSALMLIILSFYCLKKANTKAGFHLSIFFLLLCGWCFSAALAFNLSSIEAKIELTRMRFVFVPFISISLFFLARSFSDHEKVRWPTLFGLFLIPVITMIIAVSPYYHFMIYNFKIESIFGSAQLTFDSGVWFPIHIVHSRIIFVWALVLMAKTAFTNHLITRTSWLIFFSILIPLMVDSISVFLYPTVRFIQVVPVTLTFTACCFYYAVFKENLLELAPIARNIIMDSIPDIYLVIDFRGQLVDFNLHAEKDLKLTKSYYGKTISSIAPDKKGLLAHLNVTLWNEQAYSEYEVKGQAPREFYSYKLEKIISKTSEVIGKVIIIKNISEQKKLETQLTQTVEIRTKFIGIMAHDLIGNISGHALFLESLLDHRSIHQDPDLKASVDFLLNSSQNVTRFVENLLSWSRENLEGLQLKKSPAEINHLITDSIHYLQAISIQKDIEYDINVPIEIMADVDPDMIQTVFRNIIANAIAQSPLSGLITIKAEMKPNELEISIADDGPGVNEDEINKFLHGLSLDTYKGGIGLTLCRDFIHMHNGHIQVKNKNPQGAIFSFTLPLVKS